ncbi:unnamed protein product [Chondrus crispus]|uniref:Uncharacterized protein n=1 Tax=Chondrus crispus TaxID=2769 RepID=R7QLA4_CHOCR|nr:unnamed protein product [Chondrus crispus]CDF38261.1 unnamed protein product [Chondrus crispus]|eukprot:XP_005718146.1 unnamed protein product [Chondrus crispus]
MAQATGATGLLLSIARPAWTTVKLLYAIDIENKRPLRDDEEEEDEEELLDEPEVAVETLETAPGSGNVRRRRPSTPHSKPYQTRSRTRLQRQITFEVEDEASGANLRPPRSPSNVRLSPASEEKKSGRSDATNQPLTPPRRRRSSKRDADDPVNYQASEPAALKFWVTFGLVWTARSIMWYFVPSMLKGAIESLDITLLYVLIWAQLGITKGAEIVYGLVAGVARRRWRRGGRDRTQTANMFLRMAVAANLLRSERLIYMTGMIAESGLALTGVFFLITPRHQHGRHFASHAAYTGSELLNVLRRSHVCAILLADPECLFEVSFLPSPRQRWQD